MIKTRQTSLDDFFTEKNKEYISSSIKPINLDEHTKTVTDYMLSLVSGIKGYSSLINAIERKFSYKNITKNTKNLIDEMIDKKYLQKLIPRNFDKYLKKGENVPIDAKFTPLTIPNTTLERILGKTNAKDIEDIEQAWIINEIVPTLYKTAEKIVKNKRRHRDKPLTTNEHFVQEIQLIKRISSEDKKILLSKISDANLEQRMKVIKNAVSLMQEYDPKLGKKTEDETFFLGPFKSY